MQSNWDRGAQCIGLSISKRGMIYLSGTHFATSRVAYTVHSIGNRRVNVTALSVWETERSPLCSVAIFFATASPRPVPFCFVVTNGSNMFDKHSIGIGIPKLVIDKFM